MSRNCHGHMTFLDTESILVAFSNAAAITLKAKHLKLMDVSLRPARDIGNC